jgi:uracil-DNA glycosylase
VSDPPVGKRKGRITPSDSLPALTAEIPACHLCPRLISHCRAVAAAKRAKFADWDYWGRPVPGFGDPNARIWIVGLAPAAHGANRTGRVFTGDRSGDFLFAALHRASLANQPHSVDRADGLRLTDVYISSAARCAPPANKLLPAELANCAPFLDREWKLLSRVRVMLALGKVGWDAAIDSAKRAGENLPGSKQHFAHGAELKLAPNRWLIGSYHVSQQNTFTGRLTPHMFDAVIRRCAQVAAM